ncbi:DUF3558 domain-containing protein [Amycolatopsis granulosa]|uniref:DUF3558 domain-containing protein n=1 Tax=Amycolatopsis granulosa TaxID=185684 RepID=UPI001423B9D7|nr:DUF3558 domain-containing protein [Amycolatopsis granulosa]NIH86332.1 hypothetical protein [Amycolatopsis granulosa]
MNRTATVAAAGLIAAGLLTACSSGGSTAAPEPGAPSVDPAPRVPAPLPADALVADPCSALPPELAAAGGLTPPGERYESPGGPACRWQSAGHDANKIFLAPLGQQKTGLTGVYVNRDQDAYFEPTTIEGYPAVYAANADLRGSGTCALWLGLTDELVVNINSSILAGPNAGDPCPVVGDVAATVVRHLKGAA